MATRYIGDYHVALEVKYMYYIPFNSLIYSLLIDIEHVKITWSETIWAYSKFENW